MRLTDYVMAPDEIKKQYFNTLTMQVGLRYFGGKAIIGKYLINRVMEMQAYRYITDEYEPAKYFVDCFTGGGKMALTIPTGWFDTIVMNDLNYGVYSYYKCCQSKPLALLKMIENLGKIMCYDVFMICAQERSNRGKHLSADIINKLKDDYQTTGEIDFDMILSAAMTYWVTQGSWLGETDPDRITYALNVGTKNEKEEIRKVVARAKKRIMNINQKMTRQTYIIENMDYVKLIEKYHFDKNKNIKEDVIWYLDPPYHEATLNKSNGYNEDGSLTTEQEAKSKKDKEKGEKESKPAPYEDSFSYPQTMAMTHLLSTMKWFIKSDYDPYFFFKDTDDYYHDFDIIENLEEGFYREYLGSFHKGTSTGHDEGMEVIWTRYDGSKESLVHMGVTAEDRRFWKKKKHSRELWLQSKTK